MHKKVLSGFAKFWRDEGGSSTVELVIWLPAFLLIMAVIVDASLVLMSHANMWNVARDSTRRISIHEFSAPEAISHAQGKLGGSIQNEAVVTAFDDGPEVWVEITVPVDKIQLFGVLGFVAEDALTARVTQSLEPV